ncbi:MAG TPA: nickel pincer cofactor biosynthesis protein LarC [Dehalococcoidia bacterium]|nr:nickel pincer cofactor biosynthesis protein LarC [Dehalococcoidia bacterium]
MSRVGYLDCFSGISGDMLLGALIDAGAPEDALRAELSRLRLPGWRLETRRVRRAGLAAVKADVVLEDASPPHRRLGDVLGLIEAADVPEADRERGAAVFRALAEAEARVHGVAPEEVEFHEVGAVDAIVDVMGAVAGLRLLGVDELYASALPAGSGAVRGAHGELPLPAPATLELLASAGAPLTDARGDAPFELVTPTGAAIVTTLATFGRPAMRLERVGYGAGAREVEGRPNVLRLWVGERVDDRAGTMLQIETNIDDLNPEVYGYVQERLFAAGAADVWFTPIQMKKNRPAVLLAALCPPEREEACVRALLRETSTLGVRVSEVRRHEAARETMAFESSLGPAEVKVKRLPGEAPRVAPEYESCRRLAEATGLPLVEVYRIVQREAEERLS